jgi:hypothetical protein
MESKIPIFSIYNGLEDDIKLLKYKSIDNFKKEIDKLDIGISFIAEWIDEQLPILYNDRFLICYKNFLYYVTFSIGMKQIEIGGRTFQRFDTIDMSKCYIKYKSYLSYTIDKSNFISRDKNKTATLSKTSKLVFRDLLRINKIAKLLEE